MNGFERRRQQKQESIRQAAARLFFRNGVEKVTIQEVAAEANVSYAFVFKYFGSKQQLVLDVLKWGHERIYQELESILTGDKPYLERVQAMMFHKGKVFDMLNPDILKHANSYDPEETSRIDAEYEEKKRLLYYQFFQEGKQKGYVHPDVPVDSIILCRNALRALIQTHPEIISEFKHDKGLFKGYMRILLFGITGKGDLPDIVANL